MNIWKYGVNHELTTASVYFGERFENALGNQPHGKSLKENWQPLWIGVEEEDQKDNIQLLDFIWTPTLIPVISSLAKDHLMQSLGSHVEFLPLRWYPDESRELYAMNVLTILDCLDLDKSKLFRSPKTNKILNIDKYVFKSNCVEDVPIFKIPQSKVILVTDSFIDLIESSDLVGFSPTFITK